MTQLVRHRATLIIPIVALAAAACTDATAPEQRAPAVTTAAMAASPGRTPHFGKHRDDDGVTEFVVNPRKDESFTLGGTHLIVIPAGAVCDPATSSYGMGTWDDPCNRLSQPIRVTAYTWRGDDGLPRVEFVPALRFSPDRVVQLWMKARQVKDGGDFSILYCGDDGNTCVDESQSDPSLKSFVLRKGGVVYRRIKHFSVYNVAAEASGFGGEVSGY